MTLKTCGCCEGVAIQTPQIVNNRSGLNAIGYRVGEHGHFKASLLARLAGALPALRTREDDDFTISLLDAWATVADVLTFYQERIANESYLRTATERRSLLELARLIGYELRPGVAASAYLAFTLEDRAGEITIPAGTQVQSMPGENELPQKFETSKDILARPEWNEIKARLTRRHPFLNDAKKLLGTYYVAGVGAGITPGDYWLIEKGTTEPPDLRVVSGVTQEAALERTRVDLQPPPPPTLIFVVIPWLITILQSQPTIAPSPLTATFKGQTVNSAQFKAQAITQQFKVINILKNLQAAQPPPPRIMTFRVKAAIFGHNVPSRSTLPANLRVGELVPTSSGSSTFVAGPFNADSLWVDAKTVNTFPNANQAGANNHFIFLDTTYDQIVADSTIVLQDSGYWQHYKVLAVETVSLAEFNQSGKVTRLTIEIPQPQAGSTGVALSSFRIRTTTVYAQSEVLELARLPIETPVQGDLIELNGWIDGLATNQMIVIQGEDADDRGNMVREVAVLKDVEHVVDLEGQTQVRLNTALQYHYVRESVIINANVALATHGETKQEVLGSGRGEEAFPSFPLRHAPLTYVSSAESAAGAAATLEVRVDGVRWREVPDFRDSTANDRHYILRRDDNGSAAIHMGDGQNGARVPTGTENVVAVYRAGIGRPGNVGANRISLLARRPLGVQRVNNPLPAAGGADREQLEEARQNASITILTLERIVSLQDYEVFAQAFAGISKALATWTWVGEERSVFLTVAGVDGAIIGANDDVYGKLLRAMRDAGDANVQLRMAASPSYRPVYFIVEGNLTIHPDYLASNVLSEVEAVLRHRFSFTARQFGQPVALSEVVATIQNVAGVIAVDIDFFYRTDKTRGRSPILIAELPQSGGRTTVRPAELLLLDPRPLAFGVKQDG